jgi:hypothetical protein
MKIRFLVASALLLVLAACSDTPDSQHSSAPSSLKPAPAHGSSAAPAPGGPLKYSPPADWIAEHPSSSMRQAQYRLPKAEGDPEDGEVVVFYFQGGGGGVQANIDRWIGQFQKPDGSPANDAARTTKREVHGIPLTLVDVSGTYMSSMGPMLAEVKAKPGFRMLGAVAETSSGPWFFRMTGPSKTVARWEPSFQSFLETLQQ